jgi:phospholipid/cholesterol/gamma-HCH transport system permease protein
MALLRTAGILAGRTAWAGLRGRVPVEAFLEQSSLQFFGSFIFIAITLGFIGALGIYQAASHMAAIIPEYSVVGASFIQLMTREMGPVMVGLMVATKVGTGLAAEIGAMNVTDQLDAMRLSGASPDERVLAPRIFASMVAVFCLVVLGVAVSFISGAAVAFVAFEISPDQFFTTRFIKTPDLVVGLIKAVVFGFTVPTISMACGLEARGDSGAVGEATTKAVVSSCLAVITLDLVIGAIWELL